MAAVAIGLAALALLAPLGSGGASATSDSPWYRVDLEQGEWKGYHWSIGASGPRHVPLREICVLDTVVQPYEEDDPLGGEASGGSSCGEIPDARTSMQMGQTLGTGASALSFDAILYRPAVRKVVFLLEGGERRVFRTKAPRIPNRSEKGIPAFRYLAATFEGAPCVHRVTTYDGSGGVIWREPWSSCTR